MSHKFIHYGSDAFDISQFKPIKNVKLRNKPTYGLWGCAINSKNSWKNFCTLEHYREESLKSNFCFTIKKSAKVLKIHSKKDVEFVEHNYKLTIPEEDADYFECFMTVAIDFEKISKDYDVIDFAENKFTHFPFYTWDCDSVLIMNPEVIELC